MTSPRRHPDSVWLFRGSIPSLHVPLSTSRLHPHACLPMTRGQCASPYLHCRTLSFPTFRDLNLWLDAAASPPLRGLRGGGCSLGPIVNIETDQFITLANDY